MERKLKFCEVGNHEVQALWKAKSKVQKSCCKNCLHRIPKKVVEAVKEVKKELNVFFADAALVFPKTCENCGEDLKNYSAFERRKQTCHILPKTKHGGFPSVGNNPSNKVFMCCDHGCFAHGVWDNGDSSDRIKMNVYNLAVERFKNFSHLLTPREKIKAYKYLNLDYVPT